MKILPYSIYPLLIRRNEVFSTLFMFIPKTELIKSCNNVLNLKLIVIIAQLSFKTNICLYKWICLKILDCFLRLNIFLYVILFYSIFFLKFVLFFFKYYIFNILRNRLIIIDNKEFFVIIISLLWLLQAQAHTLFKHIL